MSARERRRSGLSHERFVRTRRESDQAIENVVADMFLLSACPRRHLDHGGIVVIE
jgi:hypothetical protein